LEDLQGEHRALTIDVLRESESGPAAQLLHRWIAHNTAAFRRCEQVLADVKAAGAPDLATLSVAVREIRNLIDATAAPVEQAKPAEEPVARVAGS
jgi:glutamate dehydrogenase